MQSPAVRPFELGISLTGGVSTGAYLAGALDFIVEALDALQDAQQRNDDDAPPHSVVLSTICGASSGALTAAALASALRFAFPPLTDCSDSAARAANPLFDAWINMTGAAELFGRGDRDVPGLPSLLDGTALDRVREKSLAFGAGLPTRPRTWLADPLRLCFPVTNLEGTCYRLPTRPDGPVTTFVQHADVLRFNLSGLGTPVATAKWLDETPLSFGTGPSIFRSGAWRDFGRAAVASAAFPLALPARPVTRARSDYAHAAVVRPACGNHPARKASIKPSFDTDGDARIRFAAVDGGLVDNSPVDLARAALNGRDVLACNDRDGRSATKAVLTIDPLLGPGRPAMRGSPAPGPVARFGQLFAALIDEARFRPDEVALAQDPRVFSRFLIAPTRDDGLTFGGHHLAGAACDGFGGYLAKAFREHDFFLGRRNAQAYLARVLTLDPANPLFECWKASPSYPRWVERYANADGELPIIPLVGSLHPGSGRSTLPDWPTGAVDLVEVGDLVEQRADLIHRKLRAAWRPGGVLETTVKLLEPLAWPRVRRGLRGWAVESLDARLRAHDLN